MKHTALLLKTQIVLTKIRGERQIMEKHSQKTKSPRRHVLVEKVPVLAAIIIAGAGWIASLYIGSMINNIIMGFIPSYIQDGLIGYIIGTLVIMLLYKLWFRPEFEGQLTGGRPGKGFLLGLVFIAYFALAVLIPIGGSRTELTMPSITSISLSFVAGIGEEFCFRGLLLGTLMRQWKDDHRKVIFAVLLTSAIFGAIHLTNINSGAGVFVSVMQAISSGFLGVTFAAVYIRSGNLLVPMTFHVLTDIMAFATNPAVSESGVVTGTYQVGDAADDVMCLILMIIGLWMLRSGVFEEVREIWNQKWNTNSYS